VSEFDHEAYDGRGYGSFTQHFKHAKKFTTLADALEFYRRVPACKPLRADGWPNRPLTAMHAEIVWAQLVERCWQISCQLIEGENT
jgi:hypothetical protein